MEEKWAYLGYLRRRTDCKLLKSHICLAIQGNRWRGQLRGTLFCSTIIGEEAFSYLNIKLSIVQGI